MEFSRDTFQAAVSPPDTESPRQPRGTSDSRGCRGTCTFYTSLLEEEAQSKREVSNHVMLPSENVASFLNVEE